MNSSRQCFSEFSKSTFSILTCFHVVIINCQFDFAHSFMDIVISKLLKERIQVWILCRSLIDETMKLIKKIRWQIFIEQLFYLWKVSCLAITLTLFAFQNFIMEKVRWTLIFFCLTLNFSLSLFTLRLIVVWIKFFISLSIFSLTK